MMETMLEKALALGMTEEEFRQVCAILGREPTDTELAMFSVEWSEHCGYGRSRQWLKLLPRNIGKFRTAVGGDAGGIEVKPGLWVLFKMESHNHPSQIEPKSGAATGIGGIVRDILAMGARPIALVDTLRFADPSDPKARYIFTGVVDGISWYGNCLAPDEILFVRENGQVKIVSIGDFCEAVLRGQLNGRKVEVLSLDPKTSQPCWVRVLRVFKRKSDRLLEIRTSMGRRIKVTPDHPCLVMKEEGSWVIKSAKHLRLGDRLPVIGCLPVDPNAPKSLDLIALFRAMRDDIFVQTSIPPQKIARARQILRALVPSAQKRFSYLKRGHFPLSVYLLLEKELALPRDKARLYLRSGKANCVPAVIPIDEEFARLVGYYLSEGCCSRHGTTYRLIWVFNKGEQEYVRDLCNILRRLGIRFKVNHDNATTKVVLSSWFLGILFKEVLKCGEKAENKSVPEVLMRHSPKLRRQVLIGLFRGDGSVTTYTHQKGSPVKISFATASRKLFEQVILLLQDIGITPYCYRKDGGEAVICGRRHRTLPVHFVEIRALRDVQKMKQWFSRHINWRILESLGRYTVPQRSYPRYKWHNGFSTVTVADIREIPGSTVYDLEVENTHLFVTSGGLITHNCIGIPTVAGEVGFNDCYKTNCLVGVMCVGVAREHELMTSAAKGVGNAVVYVGNATGRDGIGGCSVLASQEMREALEMRPTVQLGDPFAEKCLIEACLEAFKTGAVVAVKDMGAAGLTCTTVEMAAAGGVGMVVDISLVPKREPDMQAWEVMMSESQERMLLIVERGREWEVKRIFDRWGLHCVVIGRITDDGIVRIYDRTGHGAKGTGQVELVAEIPAKAIAEAPIKNLPMRKPDYLERLRAFDFSQLPEPNDYGEALLHLLSSPNIASKAWVYEQYDHMVQINTVVPPGAADAAVLRLKDWDERLGIAVTADCNSLYCYLDPYRGAQLAIAEAARNLSCVGAEPAGVTDCLCFGNPDKPDRYWQFVECVKGIADACRELNLPVVSGNVSFYNESETSVIHPSPLIGMVGVLDDASRHATMAFKDEGDVIVLLGVCREELGGSEYLRWRFGLEVGEPPMLDWRLEKAVQKVCREGIRQGLIKSAHDGSEGGLAVCLAECCIAGNIGAQIVVPEGAWQSSSCRLSALLFGETSSRIVVTVAPKRLGALMALAKAHDCPAFVLGAVKGERLSMEAQGRQLFSVSVGEMAKAWQEGLRRWVSR
ncbi:MAG: phosphoribosylformylglycinamidine synthase subunit PurL [Armatimonadota bacterium]|nr:phosphoribosylformylglycinamidine synthase subunit PurL [Armatimonadota bacterium]MDT7971602.1 phosphoribosylformylglycinamidine synthase subunit PurL [Armatimonadota bacterium]